MHAFGSCKSRLWALNQLEELDISAYCETLGLLDAL